MRWFYTHAAAVESQKNGPRGVGRVECGVDARAAEHERAADTIGIPLPLQQSALGDDPAAADALRAAIRVGAASARSLYVHVPFCFHKCHYCDFYSFVDTRDRQPEFVAALERELRALTTDGSRATLDTLFVGGGTPSLLRVDLWERLGAALHERFDLGAAAEWTVECNPETVTPELARTLRGLGVNRVSMGAQSFDPRHLKTLERWHDPQSVARANAIMADAGVVRRSIDLIYAVPGQTMDDWWQDVETALALDPPLEHLSCYALTYEPNTPMTARMRRGEFVPADDDLEADMYEWLVARLRDAGFERYEVSNFARPGGECRHNLAYWRQQSWLAAGPSASGHLSCGASAGWRWKNVPRLTDWMSGVNADGWSPVVDVEPPDCARALRERVMLGLRLAEGLDEASLLADAALAGRADDVREAITHERATGTCEAKGGSGRLRLTDRGFLLADGVAGRLMRALG